MVIVASYLYFLFTGFLLGNMIGVHLTEKYYAEKACKEDILQYNNIMEQDPSYSPNELSEADDTPECMNCLDEGVHIEHDVFCDCKAGEFLFDELVRHQEMMTDEHALQYAIEALCDLYVHCNTEEEREELNEAIQTLESMRKSYDD